MLKIIVVKNRFYLGKLWFGLFLALLLAWSAMLVSSWMVRRGSYVLNEGVFFGLGNAEIRQLGLALAIMVIWAYVRWYTFTRGEKLGISLVVGGAVGNMGSRVVWGGVVDYWQFLEMFSYNLADGWITLGVGIFLYSSMVSYFPRV